MHPASTLQFGGDGHAQSLPQREEVAASLNNREKSPLARNLNGGHEKTQPHVFRNNQQQSAEHGLSSSNKETALLRHFRYNIAPWIDVGDPECPFGIKAMLLARERRPFLAVILALAARHKALVCSPQESDELESAVKFRQEAEHGFVFEEDHITPIARALLMLEEFLCSSPLQWKNLLLYEMDIQEDLASLSDEANLARPLLWLYFRIGTYFPLFYLFRTRLTASVKISLRRSSADSHR